MSTARRRGGTIVIALLGLLPLLAASPAETVVRSRTFSFERPHFQPTASADSTALGVVWTPPDPRGAALRQLNRIHAAGATAVRLTRLPAADTLFARADSLGLRLFVDLPVSHVPASALRDSLRRAQPILDRLRTLAQQHTSVQYVGLAHYADTTVPTTCSVLTKWTHRLKSPPDTLRTYYVTPFSASADRCAGAVDLTLLDTRSGTNPVDRWQNWTTDTTRIGLGPLGTWVRPGTPSGLRVPHSPERQARYLERALSGLLDSLRAPPPVLFVHRWQDRRAPLPFRRYGLHDRSGTPRPAADVAKGFYTATQRVFAFPSGSAPSTTPPGLVLFGWGLILLLAGLYARSPFFRQTTFRYFAAHGFYRDAVRKGRDVSPAVNTSLLLLATTAFGGIILLLSRIAARTPSTEHVVAALPSALQSPITAGLAQPVLAGILIGGFSLVLLVGWLLGLVLVGRQNTTFSLGQGLMLIIWPCWPVFVGFIVALVTATQPPISQRLLVQLLFGGGIGAILAITIRILRDYRSVTGVSLPRMIGLTILSPFALLLIAFTILVTRYDLPLFFLWRLLTQT